MKITVSGNLGSGKSTVAKMLAKKYNLKHYSTGDFMRKMAEDRGITLLELSKIADKDKRIDKEIDNMTKSLTKEDNFVMDSRLAFHFLPESIKIFLKVSPDVSAKRIFKEGRKDEKYNVDLEKTKQNILTRFESERKRYAEYYGIDYTQEKHYDLVVDTDNKTPEEVLNKIVEYIEKNKKV
ncbi:nucleoside monophosphate kinase [archaeon]|nr:nucleoside monophosphate kinase [archaeon]